MSNKWTGEKKPPQAPPKEGMSYWMKICNTLLAYPPLSEWDSPPFGGVGGGFLPFSGELEGLEAFPVTALHVTRYIFAYGVFVGEAGSV